jgi:hypothetical protein
MTLFILYSAATSSNVQEKLGLAEYSYYFVREKFRLMLQKRGAVTVVTDPEKEVDAIYDAARSQGRDCVFLAFAPPHKMPSKLRCPTIPIFAWEFDTIPDEGWDGDTRNDWRTVLSSIGLAITHSQYSVRAIKSGMGADFPVESIPAPLWDEYQLAEVRSVGRSLHETVKLGLRGAVVDSHQLPQTPTLSEDRTPVVRRRRTLGARLKLTGSYAAAWYRDCARDLLPPATRKGIAAAAGDRHHQSR